MPTGEPFAEASTPATHRPGGEFSGRFTCSSPAAQSKSTILTRLSHSSFASGDQYVRPPYVTVHHPSSVQDFQRFTRSDI